MAEEFAPLVAVGKRVLSVLFNRLAINQVIVDTDTFTATGLVANTTDTFPVDFDKVFPSVPAVMLTSITGVTASSGVDIWPSAVSVSGFTLNINKGTTANHTIRWLAILPKT